MVTTVQLCSCFTNQFQPGLGEWIGLIGAGGGRTSQGLGGRGEDITGAGWEGGGHHRGWVGGGRTSQGLGGRGEDITGHHRGWVGGERTSQGLGGRGEDITGAGWRGEGHRGGGIL